MKRIKRSLALIWGYKPSEEALKEIKEVGEDKYLKNFGLQEALIKKYDHENILLKR